MVVMTDDIMNLITETQLREWLGYRRRADIERALKSAGVRVINGQGGTVCTTERWLTEAGNLPKITEVEFK